MNPLLENSGPIRFDRITADHMVPAVREAVRVAEVQLAGALNKEERTYASTLGALDAALERLLRVVALVSHYEGFMQDDAVRAAAEEAREIYTPFYSRLWTNPDLLALVEAVLAGDTGMSDVERRHAESMRDDLRRSGAHLDEATRQRICDLELRLSDLTTRYGNNVLDATRAFKLHITEEGDLSGLPERARGQARRDAEAAGLDGWLITMHFPSRTPFLKYSTRRDLRQIVQTAAANLASSDPYDNRPIIQEILALRQELAGILGCSTWAEHVLADSMARTPEAARSFADELTVLTAPHFAREREAIEALGLELGIDAIEPWDVAYLIEESRRRSCDFDDEQIRPYYELNAVMAGAFEIARRLFAVEITPASMPVWHPDVRSFTVSRDGVLVGHLYTDWFPRASKQGGAWMCSLRNGGSRGDSFEPHVVVISGNFTPPDAKGRSLLTHQEVTTLFHEFGHALHQLLSTVPVRSFAGTNVCRDWVEVPSQLMENWAWERDALDLFARHVDTGESLPDDLFARLRQSRTHLAAYAQMRQLSFATLDLDLHANPVSASFDETLKRVHEVVAPFHFRPHFGKDHMIASFNHLFAGDYSARYYSYKWSESLEADLFSRFQRDGLFNRETGEALVRTILSQGRAAEPSEMFRAFMGRDPDLRAIVRRNLGVECS